MSINIQDCYKSSITPMFGELKNIVNWCDNNCVGDYRYMEDINDQWHSYVFLFEEERDYVAFLLFQK